MTDHELIRFLWNHGHFFNPKYPATQNVKESDLDILTLRDELVKAAVGSFQEADANVSVLVTAMHGRMAVFDGEVGPATRMTATLKRCPVPDHPPPVGVTAPRGLEGVWDSMRSWYQNRIGATGTGSWPSSGCDPEKKGTHSIRVSIDTSNAPGAVKLYLEQALHAAQVCFGEMGLNVRYILDGEKGEINKKFENLSGTVIGWNYYPVPNTCTKIEGRYDSQYDPDWKLWANLEVHETGHGVGLPHTRGSIMNPSILLTWPLTWKGSPSEPAIRGFFGGEPVGPMPPAPPEPPSPDWNYIVEMVGEFAGKPVTVRGTMKGQPGGVFRLNLAGSLPYGIFGVSKPLTLTGKAVGTGN
jgi:hypothetical protein